MKKFTEKYYPDMKIICRNCAIFSFSIGTVIFLLYLFSKNEKAIIFGLYYTFFAIVLNFILFIFNTLCALFSKNNWKNYLINSGILLLNIPVASLYLYLVLEILDF